MVKIMATTSVQTHTYFHINEGILLCLHPHFCSKPKPTQTISIPINRGRVGSYSVSISTLCSNPKPTETNSIPIYGVGGHTQSPSPPPLFFKS